MGNTSHPPTRFLDRYLELVQDSVHPTRWNAIAMHPAVHEAHDTLVRLTQEEPERNHYGPTARLLNALSIAVFDISIDARTTEDRDHAHIFCSNHDMKPHGDIVDADIKPDYPSYIGSRAELEQAASNETHVRELSCCELGSVAEQCWRRDGAPMLRARLTALKRYRPDLPTVHGFSIHHGRIQLSQLSAAGIWSSRPLELCAIEPWIVFIILVYQAYDARDRKLVYNGQQVEFTRWDLGPASESDSQPPITLAAFYLRQPFGVTTFAAFQVPSHPDPLVAFHEEEVQGVWKSSWQLEEVSKERGLLDRLHKGGWMPGLVRLYEATEREQLVVPTPFDIVKRAAAQDREDGEHAALIDAQLPVTGPSSLPRDPANTSHCDAATRCSNAPTVSHAENTIPDSHGSAFLSALPDGTIGCDTLLRETLHLASVGEPLSQCESPRELLKVMYDLLETHIHMWDEGVLHRDLTWFNVLCKARHFIGNDANQKARPSINAILHNLAYGGEVQYQKFESSVLLIDLDNSITREELEADAQAGFYPKFGTPGFIAGDLSHPGAKSRRSTGQDTETLLRLLAVLDVEQLPHGTAALSRAFPNGDGDFMTTFRKIYQFETTSSSRVQWPTKRPVHKPRHDAESIFWVFFYAFVRTRPRGSPADEDKDVRAICECYKLLQQDSEMYIDGYNRETFLTNCYSNLGDYFHPALKAFGEVLNDIAFYLSLPWCRYESLVRPDHAHVALRRIILHHLLTLDPQTLDIPLDTERPRACPGNCYFYQSPSDRDEQTGDSTRVPSPCDCAPPAKRKATDPCEDDSSCAKRAAGGDEALPSTSARAGAQEDATFMSPTAPRGQQDRSLALSANAYRHDQHAHLRSAYAMRLKVWKDRHWFSCRAQ